MNRIIVAADRTAVLFLGLIMGLGMGFAFVPHRTAAAATLIVPPKPVAPEVKRTASPAEQPAPSMVKAASEKRPLEIGVFGDSFGEGLGQGLYQQFHDDKGFRVHQFGKKGTGFTRYMQLNLLEDIRAKLDAQPVDIAVITFGANDTFDIYSGAQVDSYMSPGWQKVIGERVDAVIALLRQRGASVYWVGLPRMRDEAFDEKITQMNAFYAARMQALGVPYINTVPASLGPDGKYTAELVDPETGKREHARAGDGIHMSTGHAYGFLTYDLSRQLHHQMELARKNAVTQVATR